MTGYSIGRLKGRLVAVRWENGKRRRYRLYATTEEEARDEIERRSAEGFEGSAGSIQSREDLTPEYVRKVLAYDPETGLLTWKDGKCQGKAAGYNLEGYVYVRVGYVDVAAHRLIWLIVHGRWPEHIIDHENGDGTDNRFTNLRECTHAENMQNQSARRNSGTGFMGVSFHRRAGRYSAQIIKEGVKHHLGYFDTVEKAHEAYLTAKAEMHSFQPVPRMPTEDTAS